MRDDTERAGAATCLYLIRCGNMVKAGIARDPHARMATLQVGNPDVLSLASLVIFPSRTMAREAEKRFHRRLDHRRVSGEWFRVDVEEACELMTDIVNRMTPRRRQDEILFPDIAAAIAYLEALPHSPALVSG